MTEPGYVHPPAPGWWERTNRIGTAETEVTVESSASGLKPSLYYRAKMRPASPRVGPMGLRNARKAWRVAGIWGGRPPVVEGVGAGNKGAQSINWTDTVPATATFAVIWVANMSTLASPSITATVGGSSCTQITGSPVQYAFDGSYYYHIHAFILVNPPTGAGKTVAVSKTAEGGNLNADVVYYSNVGSYGTMTTATGGAGSNASLSVPASDGRRLYTQAFSYRATGSNTFSAYNQTQRYLATAASYTEPLLIGDAAGNGGALSFTATRSETSYEWGGAAFPLLPA